MAFTKGDKVTLHNVNEGRKAMKFPEIIEETEGVEVTFDSYCGEHHGMTMCRVTGLVVTRDMPGGFYKEKPKDIKEFLLPETCIKAK